MAAKKSDSDEKILHVLPREVGETVAAAMRRWQSDLSWSQIKKLFETRRVMLNGNICTDSARRLKLQDVAKILAQPIAAPPSETDIRILYCDNYVVVAEKPPGVTSTRHDEEKNWPARRKQIQPTFDEMLPAAIALYEEGRGKRYSNTRDRAGIGKNKKTRPGSKKFFKPVISVHRLDRDTTGTMVFARTKEAAMHLQQQFRKHSTERRYLAIVHGNVAEQTLESSFVRDRGDGIRGSTTLPGVGKKSITYVKPLEKLGKYTLVECRPKTGRTHQIRIHLAEAGHPLCGEKIYLQPLFKPAMKDTSRAPRICLHAAELTFEHPQTGERMFFKTPLPEDMQKFLETLQEKSGS